MKHFIKVAKYVCNISETALNSISMILTYEILLKDCWNITGKIYAIFLKYYQKDIQAISSTYVDIINLNIILETSNAFYIKIMRFMDFLRVQMHTDNIRLLLALIKWTAKFTKCWHSKNGSGWKPVKRIIFI